MFCVTMSDCTVRDSAAAWGNAVLAPFISTGAQPSRASCQSPQWGDREVTTLEGLLEDGKPNKLQQAFIDEEAAQCGYCISGMVMRAQALLRTKPNPTDNEIRNYMRPNLCRCGTHTAIMRAIKRAAIA
jgi:aerobic-type carbon monoxide dehydrogenase small subunit (CoxS/CutS family)